MILKRKDIDLTKKISKQKNTSADHFKALMEFDHNYIGVKKKDRKDVKFEESHSLSIYSFIS